MADFEDDGFVELAPAAKFSGRPADVVVSTSSMRGGPTRLVLNLSRTTLAAVTGGARIRIAWNPKSFTLRLSGADDGPFEASKSPKGDRYLLRIPLPEGVKDVPKLKEPCPFTIKGGVLFCLVPPPLRVEPPKPSLAAAQKAVIEHARAAAPAPSFSTRR